MKAGTAAWAIPALSASFVALLAWLRLARQFSGQISTTEADKLWIHAKEMRDETRQELSEARARIAELERREDELERRLAACERANVELRRRDSERAAEARAKVEPCPRP